MCPHDPKDLICFWCVKTGHKLLVTETRVFVTRVSVLVKIAARKAVKKMIPELSVA